MAGARSGEFRGKTIETAINAGLAALQLAREDVEIEVVRPGSRGVLGIGAEDAVVLLTEKRAPRPGAEAKSEARSAPSHLAEGESGRGQRPARGEPRPAASEQRSASADARPAASEQRSASADARPAASEPRREPAPSESAASLPGEVSPKSSAAADQGGEFLTGLLQRMGLDATVEVGIQSPAEAEEGDRVAVLNIVGDDLGGLIGRQNEVVSAIEFITRLAVNQKSHNRSQFVVDVNGYRAKRAESLRKLALRMADQAAQTGRTVSLEPMPPSERRVVHLALRDHPKVFTQSVGEGDHRKVTLVLRKE